MNNKWWKEAVAYQIYPRSFCDSNGDGVGDINGVIRKLDYLKDLGIDVIWLGPVYPSPNDDNGYDISDYEDIMEEFGTMEDFDRLLKEVHSRGMKLIMDLVINHTSDEHPWFIESRSSKDNPKRDWYIWRDGKEGAEPNNWESIFNGSAWEYDEPTEQYYLHVFSRKQPDLNWENEEVRQELYAMINRWLDRGIDGFRVDAISHIKKKPGLPDMPNPNNERYVECYDYMMNYEGIDGFLSELSNETLKRDGIMTVGEANGVTTGDVMKWVGEDNGYFNMIFQFEHLNLWNKGNEDGIDVQELMRILSKWQSILEDDGWNALFIENHDLTRSVSTLGDDRKYWKQSAKMLATMYFFMRGTPFIYQGQEIGMTNAAFNNIEDYNDVGTLKLYELEREKGVPHDVLMEKIKKTCRDNSRTPMQWDDTPFGGFTEADHTWLRVNENYKHINVAKQSREDDSVLSYYKKMIRLRKEDELFLYGTYKYLPAGHPSIAAYKREWEGKKALILCNFGGQPVSHPFNVKQEKLILHNYDELQEDTLLEPYEARVYIIDRKCGGLDEQAMVEKKHCLSDLSEEL